MGNLKEGEDREKDLRFAELRAGENRTNRAGENRVNRAGENRVNRAGEI